MARLRSLTLLLAVFTLVPSAAEARPPWEEEKEREPVDGRFSTRAAKNSFRINFGASFEGLRPLTPAGGHRPPDPRAGCSHLLMLRIPVSETRRGAGAMFEVASRAFHCSCMMRSTRLTAVAHRLLGAAGPQTPGTDARIHDASHPSCSQATRNAQSLHELVNASTKGS